MTGWNAGPTVCVILSARPRLANNDRCGQGIGVRLTGTMSTTAQVRVLGAEL
jgi:hypothetical protein